MTKVLWFLLILAGPILPTQANDDATFEYTHGIATHLYAVIFKIFIDESGQLTQFEVSKVIDAVSGSTDAVDIKVPDKYVVSARAIVEAAKHDPYMVDGQPTEFFQFYFYDPGHPDVVITEIKK